MEFKHELVIPNEDLSFRMFLFEGYAGNYVVNKHWHTSIEIFAVFEGCMDYYINKTSYHLEPGNFVLLNSNEIHSICAPEKNRTIVLQIPLKTFEKYYTGDSYIGFSHSPREQDEKIMKLIENMYQVYKKHSTGYEFKVQSQYFMLLYQLVSKYRIREIEKDVINKNKKMNHLSKITSYIREHYKEKLSLEAVAQVFGYSSAYLSRIFLLYAQINYKDFVQNVRFENAYKEFLNSDETINEIALNNGFPNSKAFTKVFQNKLQISPSDFRKAHKHENDCSN